MHLSSKRVLTDAVLANVSILYPMKMPENVSVFQYFQGV